MTKFCESKSFCMKKDIKVYFDDINECIRKIEEYTQGVSYDDFFKDSELQDAIMRRLEIIGEAVKNIPKETKELYLLIPWRQIAGMRDVLIHEYSGVKLDRVWEVIEKDIPHLKEQLCSIVIEEQ